MTPPTSPTGRPRLWTLLWTDAALGRALFTLALFVGLMVLTYQNPAPSGLDRKSEELIPILCLLCGAISPFIAIRLFLILWLRARGMYILGTVDTTPATNDTYVDVGYHYHGARDRYDDRRTFYTRHVKAWKPGHRIHLLINPRRPYWHYVVLYP